VDWVELRAEYVTAHRTEFAEVLGEQSVVVQSVWQQLDPADVAVPHIFERARWDKELETRLLARNRITASDYGWVLARDFGIRLAEDRMDAFIVTNAELTAGFMNAATERALQEALVAPDERRDGLVTATFTRLLSERLDRLAQSSVTMAANLGRSTAAEQAGRDTKEWATHSEDSRHAALAGQRVGIDELFSNGLSWPGDPHGDGSDNDNCQCSVEFP
jgi:hypothetical protein